MTALIDPTVTGKYPVILGDGLLGKTSNEIFTGIRCTTDHTVHVCNGNGGNANLIIPGNHKPPLSSDDAPNHARLRPSLPGKTDSYDLSFTDGDGSYAYAGTRNTDSNQYVLHFDPGRKAFVLDRVDSTFNMNLTRIPGTSDPERLRRQHPHLDSQGSTQRDGARKSGKGPPTTASKAKEPKRKAEKKLQPKDVALSLPEPEKPKPKAKQPSSFNDDEDEEEDDDGGLLIEYPGGDNAKKADFSPAFPPPRRFDDFMDQRDSEADDADGESDDEPDMDFKLPSPVNNHASRPDPMDEDNNEDVQEVDGAEEADGGAGDLEDDLEKEMEIAFEDLANSPDGTPHGGDESEISEED